ncbi:MAG: hypothetical protein HRT72_13735 [Flavobacteriales bacterium]|nr:hypothetical protein [Flavobacteriales bacterium]
MKFLILSIIISALTLESQAQIIILKDVKETSSDNNEITFSETIEAYGSGSQVSAKFKRYEPSSEILATFKTQRPNEEPTHWNLVYHEGDKENVVYHVSFGTIEKDDGVILIDKSGNWIGTKYYDESWHYPAQSWSIVRKTISKLNIETLFEEYITIKKPEGIYCMYRCLRTDNTVMKIEFNEKGNETRIQEIQDK